MRENELLIPPETSTDPKAFELLRVWAANNEIHVALVQSVVAAFHLTFPS